MVPGGHPQVRPPWVRGDFSQPLFPGRPWDARRCGGPRAVGDVEGAMRYLRSLPYVNGKVGVFGTCSGGRHAFLVACRVKGFDAAVDCWGGRVVMSKEELTAKQPVAPIDYTKDLP